MSLEFDAPISKSVRIPAYPVKVYVPSVAYTFHRFNKLCTCIVTRR